MATLGLIAVALAVLLCIYGIWRYARSYIGFGVLFVHHKDGSVIVESRLLDSPASRAGLVRYEQLLEYNGVRVAGLPVEAWRRVLEEVRPKMIGEKASLKFKRRLKDGSDQVFEVVMPAERIWQRAPDYSGHVWSNDTDDGNLKRGMFYCMRTGYLVPTVRLSDKALDAIFKN